MEVKVEEGGVWVPRSIWGKWAEVIFMNPTQLPREGGTHVWWVSTNNPVFHPRPNIPQQYSNKTESLQVHIYGAPHI